MERIYDFFGPLSTFGSLSYYFSSNSFLVAGDPAYCIDVLGCAKIAFGLDQGGVPESPEGRTDVILTATEHDTGNLLPVGGPAINSVADEFNGYFGITYQYAAGSFFQITAEGYILYLNLANYPQRDICIVYLSEQGGRTVLLVWGYGWYGTYAGSVFIGDPDNWLLYSDAHMLMLRWIDQNADGLVQMNEITVEQSV
jgi:hypothetical protein